MDYTFEDCTKKCLIESIKANYDDAFENRILQFASRMANVKRTEQHHSYDNRHEVKRISTGLLGEAALV